MLNESMTCMKCRHWTGDARDDKGIGECHRYPPQVAGVIPIANALTRQPQPSAVWVMGPEVRALYSCGEFSPREVQ